MKTQFKGIIMNGNDVMKEVKEAGFDAGLAIATDAEVNAGAACGQMAILDEVKEAGFDAGLAIATDAEVDAGAACGQMAILEDA